MPASNPPDATRANVAAAPELSVPQPADSGSDPRDHRPALCTDTGSSPSPVRCLHQQFEAQAAATPDAEALVEGRRRVSYRELNARANRVAHRLIHLGVGPETLVGVYLERSADLVAALLGVLKAGGAYVPLDPIYPSDRLSFILGDARVHTVLTQASLHDALRRITAAAGHEPVCVSIDTDEQLAYAASDNPAPAAAPGNLAYVLHTPGSIASKGVAIEHRNAASLVHWAGGLYSPRELSGVLACTSICFDPSILELFVPLSFGGRIILAENILTLRTIPAVDDIRLLDTVPSVARELLRIDGLPPSLETINLGGEPVSDRLVRQLYARPHIQRVYNQYGPVETTTIATSILRVPGEPATLGFPITRTQVHLLDDEHQPVPPGSIGELCIGGAGVARGYLNRPKLTAQKFIPNPFSAEPGARLYRTGDLCRHRPDGRLEYIGRVDEQVHIDGHHVRLGDIESALRTHPSVAEAMVMLREDVPGHPRLIAYVVPQSAAAPQAELNLASELCRCLKARPHHLLPVFFALLALVTMLANGRAERISQHAPLRLRVADYNATSRTPRNRTEDALVRIRNRLLGAKPSATSRGLADTTTPARSELHTPAFRTFDLTLNAPRTRPLPRGCHPRIARSSELQPESSRSRPNQTPDPG